MFCYCSGFGSLVYVVWVMPSPPFFFRLASNAFPDIGSIGRIAKKKTLKKITRNVLE